MWCNDLLIACLFLSGCSKKTTGTGGSTVTEKPPEKKKQEELIINETVAENDVPALISQAKEFQKNITTVDTNMIIYDRRVKIIINLVSCYSPL